ncbi:MAG: hypothetical protein ABSA52_13365 [Candidatus Binatia bacterium]|jgi:hypothetical protein
MIGASDPQASIIAATLDRCFPRVEQSGRACWTFTLSNGTDLQATALINDSWLLLGVPLSEPRLVTHELRSWEMLQWNATLPGGAKFAVLAAGLGIHARAELPLDDDVNLPSRVVQACAGLNAASAKFRRLGAARSPLPSGGPVLSPVEGGQDEGVRWIWEEDDTALNTQIVECAPAVELAAVCRESGWAFAERSGKLVVDLDVPGSFQQAVAQAKTPCGVAVSVDVTTSSEPLAMPCREALALLLLRTCGVVRMVRAAVQNVGSGMAARFEVLFGDTPCGAELSHAFSALSVACRIAGHEAVILQHDEIIARAYPKTSLSPLGSACPEPRRRGSGRGPA